MRRFPPFLAVFYLLTAACVASAQSGSGTQAGELKRTNPTQGSTSKSEPAPDPEAERIVNERHANAQSLLIALAADAGKFNDSALRARTQARIADMLWKGDRRKKESARSVRQL